MFCACLVSVQVSAPYGIAGSTQVKIDVSVREAGLDIRGHSSVT